MPRHDRAAGQPAPHRHDLSRHLSPERAGRSHAPQADSVEPAVECAQVQPRAGAGDHRLRAAGGRTGAHQRARHGRRARRRTGGAAVPALQPAGAGGRHGRGQRHRPGGHQAPGGTDGWQHRRDQRARRGQHLLDRAARGRRLACARPAGLAAAGPGRGAARAQRSRHLAVRGRQSRQPDPGRGNRALLPPIAAADGQGWPPGRGDGAQPFAAADPDGYQPAAH